MGKLIITSGKDCERDDYGQPYHGHKYPGRQFEIGRSVTDGDLLTGIDDAGFADLDVTLGAIMANHSQKILK